MLQICQNSTKFLIFLVILLQNVGNFFIKKLDCRAVQRSGLCRSRRELSNAHFLAKFRFATAENEPCQVCPTAKARRRGRRRRDVPLDPRGPRHRVDRGAVHRRGSELLSNDCPNFFA